MINLIKAVISQISNLLNNSLKINTAEFIKQEDYYWDYIAVELEVNPQYKFQSLPEFKNDYYNWN